MPTRSWALSSAVRAAHSSRNCAALISKNFMTSTTVIVSFCRGLGWCCRSVGAGLPRTPRDDHVELGHRLTRGPVVHLSGADHGQGAPPLPGVGLVAHAVGVEHRAHLS